MQLKAVLAVSAALFFGITTNAQDRIYTKNGGMYEVKIKEIGTRNIVYKKWSNQDGPEYVMPKSDVERIKFQNGDEEQFGRTERPRGSKTSRTNTGEYGKNIIGLSPVHMTNVGPVGFGLSYERMLDRNNIVSFYIPVVYSFNNYRENYYHGGGTTFRNERNMLWFFPGAKIYPTGSDGVVRYSVGPSLAFGTGNQSYTQSIYDPISGATTYKQINENVFVMGILVNNTLNVQPTPKLRLGLELGVGIPYYTNENRDQVSYYYNSFYDVPLVQFNFTVGYRF